ncbi:P-loop NTPase [Chloroflexota bacterium]
MIISVASGKGGTGKTLVATSLAMSISEIEKVQLLDCDVEEPNDCLLLRPNISLEEAVCIPVPKVDEKRCTYCGKCADVCVYHAIAVSPKSVLLFNQLCHGCGACSYLCPEKAISEEMREIGIVKTGRSGNIDFTYGELTVGEAMAPPVIREVKKRSNKDRLIIIDVSPGTSCPVVESIKGSDFCLLVTEPTPFGLNDLILAVETARVLGVPCGIILNRAGQGNSLIEEYCQKENIPLLLSIPMDTDIARLYSRGITLAEGKPEWKMHFRNLYRNIQEIVNERTGSTKR